MADSALDTVPEGYSIALVHSPEMAVQAAERGYSLYLCGHTHGGQICLPGGRPMVKRLIRNRSFAAGLWRCGRMSGYTNSGAGVSGPPLRYFSRGEAALVTLRRAGGV
jgi:predicted MPP superfamily phosphohydrolase